MENVPQCPLWFVIENFGEGWTITPIYTHPSDACFDHVGRPRVYFVCTCNETCERTADIEAVYRCVVTAIRDNFLRRSRCAEPRDAIIADDSEVLAEEIKTAESKGIRPQCGTLMRSPCLSYLLSPSEKLHLVLYHILWFELFGVQAQHDPNAIFNLADNPLNRVSWSACGKLPGFRRSAGRYWHASSRRWLTDKERLAALGLPVYQALASATKCDVLHVNEASAKNMAGNAWHAQVASLVLMVSWACVRTKHPWVPM